MIRRSLVAALLAGMAVAALAFFAPFASVPAIAQIKEMTVGPDGRPIKIVPYGTEDYEGLIPKGTESRGDATRRLQAYTPDPVKFPVPRTTWDGKPDFSGVYWPTATMVPAPVKRESLYRPEVEALRAKLSPDDTPGMHCWPGSPANGAMTGPLNVQMVHGPGIVVMIDEYMGNFRIIPTDGRSHNPSRRRTFQGESVGRWEGDTLVVDVANFRPRDKFGDFWSESLHVVERWSRPDATVLEYENVVEDPNVLTAPWVGSKVRRGRLRYDFVLENHCIQDATLLELQERERAYRAFEASRKGSTN